MITKFEAKGFRAFEALGLSGLRPINIIVGPSSSGKTALLEAIRLALGATPQIGYSIGSTRGILTIVPQNPTREQFETGWSSLFFDFDIKKRIHLEIKDSQNHSASVDIYFNPERQSAQVIQQPPIFPGIIQTGFTGTTIVPIAFERRSLNGEFDTLYGTINQQGQLQFDQGREIGPATEFLPSTWQSNAIQVANWFSQLSIQNEEREVVEAVRSQFPNILDLTVISNQQIPVLYATMKYRSTKLPIALVSSGINKLTSLMIAIRNYRRGVVLIDEIENGIYYKMFPKLWESLYRFSIKSETQLFLSTHSWECLTNAADLINQHPGDFNIIQVFQEEGRSDALVVPGEDAAAAIESGIEIRK